ncbi:putative lipid II flippase FtsW [Luteibacter sahnii]|jgi:cell division protein FtsW|uniref:putative lipid II flippase FtsW n=1 Tax=Luteibacter sahnii TaxID=3021977 RepID=UPI002A69CC54|nr:putative lipid II flippase FtsW [Luteibacter sp. PPL193]MDY1548441.1 putative lipid II flippase FtsW [Luteibacter sp. PPL193]
MFGFGNKQAQRRQGPRGSFDVPLLLAALALAAMGVVMVTSSSIAVADGSHVGAFYYLKKHLGFLAMGCLLAGIAMRTELKFVEKHSTTLLLLGIFLLLVVFVPGFGMRINGARRWINLVVTGFQPVEAVKLILVAYLSSYLVRHREGVEYELVGVLKPLGIAAMIAALLLLQPDFGSAMLILSTSAGMVWLAGARKRYLIGLAFVAVIVLAYVLLSKDYRVRRLTSFLDPFADPYNDGFQLSQALIAVGRGEWTGVGLGSSVQKLFYLPEAHTDFILAVLAEELGLAGIVGVVGLYIVMVGRGLYLGLKGVELGQRFSGYVAYGISLMLGLQATVSIGVNLGVLPTKGLTLPLISSGGSSVMMTCAMVGVLLRATFEINRAEDARQSAVRQPAAAVPTSAPIGGIA